MNDYNRNSNLKAEKYTRLVKIIIVIFIVSGFLIGFLNSVSSRSFDPITQEIFHFSYVIYESIGRTAIVIFSSIITIQRAKWLRKKVSRFRFISLTSLSVSILILLVIIPLLANTFELYLVFMPFPWSSAPFQLILAGTIFGFSFVNIFGPHSIQITIIIYLVFQLIVFIGVFLLGRRWYCSLICPLNGCHAESFGDFLPFRTINKKRPKSKALNKKIKNILKLFQIAFIILNLLLIISWVLEIYDIHVFPSLEILTNIELYKYLLFELILMLLGWMIIGGRSYCYYCPSGTFIGILGKLNRQKIETGLTKCTQCGLCNDVCKMSIDIQSKASKGEPVESIDCVGCGLCVDACPHKNLRYTTYFLDKIRIN